jgi:drug/metabolite transporter (DMT)-like permease
MNGSNNYSANGATWWQAALMIRGQTKAEQRNIRSVWIWCLVWATGFLAVTSALAAFPQLRGPFAWLLAMIPIVLGFPAVLACVRFIREADEFMRKVQLDGIAIGFAAGCVFCLGYHTLEHVGAPHLPMIVATVPLVFGWAIGSFIVAFRHR